MTIRKETEYEDQKRSGREPESSTAGVHVAEATRWFAPAIVLARDPGSQALIQLPEQAGRVLVSHFLSRIQMNTVMTGDSVATKKDSIVLRVRYAPAKAPLVDPHASNSMTLAMVKATALTHFQLVEGGVDGGTKTYQLAFDDIVQTDLSISLGSLATHGNQVELLLIEQFEQG